MNLINMSISSILISFFCVSTFGNETASVLPEKIFRARIVDARTHRIEEKYDSSGNPGGLSKSLNRNLDTQSFVAMKPELAPIVNALNSIESGMGDNLLSSQINSRTTMNVDTYLAALEYGITSKWTFGIRVPVVKTEIQSDFNVVSVNNSKAIQSKIGAFIPPELNAGLGEVAKVNADTNFFKKAIFTDKGYQSPSDLRKTELGDVEIGVKYKFLDSPKQISSMQMGIRIPSGSVQKLDDLFYQGSGTGAWGVGALLFNDYYLTRKWKFGSMGKLVYNLPDTRLRAVPKNADDSLPNLIPELDSDNQVRDVTRKQALDFESELSLTYTLDNERWETWSAFQYLTSGKDQYYGSGEFYYEGLASGTNFSKTEFELGFSYSTLPDFQKKSFPVPMKIETLYRTALEGKNVAKLSYVRVDMIVYF